MTEFLNTDELLDSCVKKSLDHLATEDLYSIFPCFDNQYLSDGWDPFLDLRMEIMLKTLEEKYRQGVPPV